MKAKRSLRWGALAVAMLISSALDVPLFSGHAWAIVGRPLTPMSYAGVARRTTRRAVAVGAVARPYGYGYPVAPVAPVAVPVPVPAMPVSPSYVPAAPVQVW